MRFHHALLVTGLFTGLTQAQTQSPRAWIQSQYPDLTRVTVHEVLSGAQEAGLLPTSSDRLRLKKAYRELRGKNRFALPNWKQPTQGTQIGFREPVGIDVVLEHETNDGWQYADDMAGDVATGNCIDLNDVDSWRFDAPADGFYSFEVQGTGVTPIADSLLVLRNQKGDPLATDDDGGVGSLSRINIFLRAGTYYLDVCGYNGIGGGEYNLVALADPVNIVQLGIAGGVGTTQIPVGGVAHDVFQIQVPDSRVNVAVDSAGSDTALVVQRADGLVVFSNDDSLVGGLDAAADIDLRAGTYHIYVWNVSGAAGLPFTLTYAEAPRVYGDLIGAGGTTDAITGDESMRLSRIELLSPAHIDVMSDDAGVAPLGDTIMALLDRDGDYICDVDDDDPFNLDRGFYSRIAMSLPAGVYWIAVTPFPGAIGDYALTATSGPFVPTGASAFGPSVGSIAGFGDITTYALENCSQSSVRVMGDDFWFGILGPDGQVATNTLCAPFHPQAGELPAGTNLVYIFDRYDFSGILTTDIVPPLYLDADGVTVTVRGKEGDSVWMFANFSGLVPGFNFGAGDRGFLCLPLDPLLLTVGDRTVPAAGVVPWFTLPQGLTGVDLQTGDLHNGVTWPAPAFATWRNVFSF